MNTLTHNNILETIQFIPIFTYLNILNDYLYLKNYLTEDDQTKPIPIVNALHQFFEDNRVKKYKTGELIKILLKGSDLYGEKDNEEFDIVFANAMFHHIISSLVFEKYGNIYGFFVHIFREAENLQIDYIFNLIKENLQKASFDNEYGNSSKLTSLSVNRIFNDIILPMFPQPNKVDFNLLSHDYIYAQAGSMFLISGRISNVYYNNSKHYSDITPKDVNLFEEYQLTGYVIEKLIVNEKKNLRMLKSFALSALIYEIFNSKYEYINSNVGEIISNSHFWQMAYKNLFQYIMNISNNITDQLNEDYNLKMHFAVSSFQSRTALAKFLIDVHCSQYNNTMLKVSEYLNNPNHFECENGTSLPDLNEWYMDQINHIVSIYEKFDLTLIQQAFGESFINSLKSANVIIKLIHFNDKIDIGDFSNTIQSPYDLLQFYYPDRMIMEHYILKRESYNVTLNKIPDELQFNYKTFDMKYQKLFNGRTIYKVLKALNWSMDLFWKNFLDYKKERLEMYLQFFHICQFKNEEWKNKFWQEFSLPQQAFNFNLSTINRGASFCEITELKFSDNENDDSSNIIHTKTKELLSSLGTSINAIFLQNTCNQVMEELEIEQREETVSLKSILNRIDLFENISLIQYESTFELTTLAQENIVLLTKIINALKSKTNLSLVSITNSLNKMLILKSSTLKPIGFVGEDNSHIVYINTIDMKSDTGYGYKFTVINTDVPKSVLLRTGYEYKNEILILQIQDFTDDIKLYLKLNDLTLKPEAEEFVYEVNNQLQRNSTKLKFLGIPLYHDDDKCNDRLYFLQSRQLNVCQRKLKFNVKNEYEENIIKYVQNKTQLSEQQIRETLKKYTFPDRAAQSSAINHWINDKFFQLPHWIENYVIKNSDDLNTLRYSLNLENHNTISIFDGKFRILSFYQQRDRCRIEKEAALETIIEDYNQQKVRLLASFHDYYAIRNFATTGYSRIIYDSHEAKLMKLALYNLAIRQSDDPEEKFDEKLYRIESKPIGYINKLLTSKTNITLQKFTTALTCQLLAISLAAYPQNGFQNIVYEMLFDGPYMRGKIQQLYEYEETMIILLPGTVFTIANYTEMYIEGLGFVTKVVLQIKHYDEDKYRWYKKIMNEISQINF
ncbi:uncharacterized protein LOC127284930 [Leptopilina boulardi]|uniref:uncharacterized protein LOC127284930 n=1 Tax=Leptopilina boulardi TaxID=63433 RepID=UPI0021F5D4A4|nr:uncharacterized protein LOC127284930 [Leptopilina boulardi]